MLQLIFPGYLYIYIYTPIVDILQIYCRYMDIWRTGPKAMESPGEQSPSPIAGDQMDIWEIPSYSFISSIQDGAPKRDVNVGF